PLPYGLVREEAVLAYEAGRFHPRLPLVDALELARDERAEALAQQLHGLSDTLVVADGHRLLLLEQLGLVRPRPAALASESGDLWPALHESVVRQRLVGELLALADRVEPIG